ncbi:site-specific DNA-methyltransferase [Rhizosaccharibacter radicis]|uniref:site-specific DNA-methyltransferase (adenine-specific) n=1 Tax=Rhizosaccharibacter radicis TaxID=2782605 RepID=A0ABT1VV91_9PROT|nr:site-specific DNA-methyltransferase [Acetobacteraceae bacterium KSS12]
MDKLKMHSPDLSQENIAKIRDLFPGCVTEARDEATGQLRLAVDFDQLRQELSDHLVEGPQERYRLDWPGKREALALANAPIAKTLRPSERESLEFNSTRNLFVEGDNLEGMKLLRNSLLGQVKLIYIDPPYNTGGNFVYEDNFAENSDVYLVRSNQVSEVGKLVANSEANGRFHSDWLTMMYSRLRVARDLLREDGVIFISIDDSEAHNLRKLCDEIFGSDNFVAQNVWQKRYSRENRGVIGDAHEYILVYAKAFEQFKSVSNRVGVTEAQKKAYSNDDGDGRGPWRAIPMTAQGYRPNQMYEIRSPSGVIFTPPAGRCWSMVESQFRKLEAEGKIYFGKNGDAQPGVIRYLSESKGVIPWTWWPHDEAGHTDEARKEIKDIFGTTEVFDTPKPVRLMRRILEISTNDDDIVLDFFSGSSTMAHAVIEACAADGLSRPFVMIQMAEALNMKSPETETKFSTVAEVGKERIRHIGKKVLDGDCHSEWNRDVGFRVLKVDTSNMQDVYYRPDQIDQKNLLADVDNIKPDRTAEDLLFQVLVDWGVDLTLPIQRETVQGKTVFFVDGNALVACFETGVTEELVKELAGREPLRVVFRDNGFVSDAVKINVEQVFRQVSPGTDVKSI